jgi:excisionase family DNA binding protein
MTHTIEFLSPADVAALLKVHVKTVHIWLREGRLQGTKISYRAWRIPRTALDDFLKQKSISGGRATSGSHGAIGTTEYKLAESGSHQVSLPGDISGEQAHPPGEMKHYLKRILHEHEANRS